MADEAMLCLIYSSWHRMRNILLKVTFFALVYNKPENGGKNSQQEGPQVRFCGDFACSPCTRYIPLVRTCQL